MKSAIAAFSLVTILSACSYYDGEAQLVAARESAMPPPSATMTSAAPSRSSALYEPAEIDRRRDRPLRGF